uniref:Aminopeptidase B n=1 Tax=Cacopsylla melanoneura TaxID=428564 RepID=A0A8D8VU84_9HEMI
MKKQLPAKQQKQKSKYEVVESDSSSSDGSLNGSELQPSLGPELMRVQSLHLDWKLDFQTGTLSGHVVLGIERLESSVTQLTLNTSDLEIYTVRDAKTGKPLLYNTSSVQQVSINLTQPLRESNTCWVKIVYRKTEKDKISLSRPNTSTKDLVYWNFSTIKSWFPYVNNWDNKVLFSAVIHTSRNLTVLMSAKRVSSNRDKLQFINPHPILLSDVAIVIGMFSETKVSDQLTIYSQTKMSENHMDAFNQIPTYIEQFEQIVGDNVWDDYSIVLMLDTANTSTYPYLYLYPKEMLLDDYLSPKVILDSLSQNWFRNVIRVVEPKKDWLNQCFSIYIGRKILSKLGEDIEKDLYAGAHAVYKQFKKRKVPLVRALDIKPNRDSEEIVTEKLYIFLMIIEHYGGKYGEFDEFIKRYYEENKLQSVTSDTFANCILKYLTLRYNGEEANFSLENIKMWINDKAPIPLEFFQSVHEFHLVDVVHWLLFINDDNNKTQTYAIPWHNKEESSSMQALEHEEEKEICDDKLYYFSNDVSNTEPDMIEEEQYQLPDTNVSGPLIYLTPNFVNHRERKLKLLKALQSYDAEVESPIRFKIGIFNLLLRLGLNCDQDKDIKFEFLKLSIANRWCPQLLQIKLFVSKTLNTEHLIDIMRDMLKWQQESDKNRKDVDYKYTPMRKQIIIKCDEKLSELLAVEKEHLPEKKKHQRKRNKPAKK